ncbi:tRNA (N(6)-L-threonylcarbamoyladenosine(37)-C(2))-methylthiotransferase MtaB [Dehalogenimonas alkenigignens]|uniref:Radical SAM methylthiotransferase, MiaB/RimO family n=1 Tax=Dehalogenimonas alkenigignens TaxID=1217799 RepID=A0A0W0GJW6_9CHLR|nr:tRNA (N(6)-L-threonylcarbamoyladenosine(37)-C(2))-methylthiotransferase MtaB [Dehalogenimonas alkenigignens]KTB48833.1 radical SAM methylthiotransferase, MiaB/RimO family [Dehalogenimonas alkenigignens]PVV84760.1 tRNA (N(6)-L-threonylcarbamoyladenosine(37)-C(2))-methylthiotransferase MtaB [Dehalogenimonas alkenigignens]
MTRVLIETFGCKLNQAESEDLVRQLAAEGFEVVLSASEAEVMIFNTCAVTHIAERKIRQAIRSAVKVNPGLDVVVTGCYADRDRSDLVHLPNVTAVIGNNSKSEIPALLAGLGHSPGSIIPRSFMPMRTRSFIKIQDGCDHRCTYCIVPFVRPVKHSRDPVSIIAAIKLRQAEGTKEIVLTGTEIGEYQSDGLGLKELLDRILDETTIERIRVSSLQPQELTPSLIGLWADERLCPHFHLSLQSGSDSVLGRMRRRYSTDMYRKAVELVRSVVPDAGISTDIIAGFPGETDAEFDNSAAFIEAMNFSRLHVFPFSPRPGTQAAEMPHMVEAKLVQRRVEKLLSIGQECLNTFEKQLIGTKQKILVEGKSGNKWVGFTGNYIRAKISGNQNLSNQVVEVVL